MPDICLDTERDLDFEDTIYDDGWFARNQGFSQIDNPYRNGSKAFKVWLAGWSDADMDYCQGECND